MYYSFNFVSVFSAKLSKANQIFTVQLSVWFFCTFAALRNLDTKMNISVVISLLNEEESLPELYEWIVRVMNEHKFSYEIIFVDDGSTDNSWQIIEDMSANNPNVRGLKFRRNYGKSAALHNGFQIAKGDVVITMDADLQDSPDEIPELYQMIIKEDYDLVSGWKRKRYDPILSKNLPSKFFNWIAWRTTGIKLHDFNCGLKAYRNDVVKNIEVYGEMHRYIPVIAKNNGYPKIGEKVVMHQKRKYGYSKFGFNRFINGALDLLSISFITRFSKKPMHFFGSLGIIVTMTGILVTIWLIVEKIIRLTAKLPVREIADQPLFYVALTSVIIGIQLFLAGFVAELVSRTSPDRNMYHIDKQV